MRLCGGLFKRRRCNTCLKIINNASIQRIQNMLARVFTCSRSRSSSAPLLKHLHWLPVTARIHFKIALLTFKSLHTISPSYLSSLIRPYVPSRALRSSSAQRLCVPHVSSVFGSRGFRSAGPAIWNSLPLSVTPCSTIYTFKKQLKTHLFASAFPSSWIVLDAPLIQWSPLIYLSGCLWFCVCLNVCYYCYYYYYSGMLTRPESPRTRPRPGPSRPRPRPRPGPSRPRPEPSRPKPRSGPSRPRPRPGPSIQGRGLDPRDRVYFSISHIHKCKLFHDQINFMIMGAFMNSIQLILNSINFNSSFPVITDNYW